MGRRENAAGAWAVGGTVTGVHFQFLHWTGSLQGAAASKGEAVFQIAVRRSCPSEIFPLLLIVLSQVTECCSVSTYITHFTFWTCTDGSCCQDQVSWLPMPVVLLSALCQCLWENLGIGCGRTWALAANSWSTLLLATALHALALERFIADTWITWSSFFLLMLFLQPVSPCSACWNMVGWLELSLRGL